MLRFVSTVLLTILVLLFALQNFHTVPVGIFVGHVDVRLVFVIFSAVSAGAMVPILYSAAKRMKQGSTKVVESVEEDDFLEDEE